MNSYKLRFFNNAGINEYETLLNRMSKEGRLLSVDDLLEDNSLSTEINSGIDVTVTDFADKALAAQYFCELFQKNTSIFKAQSINPIGHKGLMTWLDAAWSPYVMKGSKGNFFVGELSRHIYGYERRRTYRHILGGPIAIYSQIGSQPDITKIFLKTGMTQNSDTYEQFASRPQILSDLGTLELIKKLYGHLPPGTEIPGANNSGKNLPGGLRRFCTLHTQLELNFDLRSMSPAEFEELLPDEFNSWLEGNPPKLKNPKFKKKLSNRRAKRKP